jgi:hypothetical protein
MKVILVILLACMAIFAEPGELDTTFDSDGMVKTTIRGSNLTANAVAIQDDGKIIVAGYSAPDSNVVDADIFVARYRLTCSLNRRKWRYQNNQNRSIWTLHI